MAFRLPCKGQGAGLSGGEGEGLNHLFGWSEEPTSTLARACVARLARCIYVVGRAFAAPPPMSVLLLLQLQLLGCRCRRPSSTVFLE